MLVSAVVPTYNRAQLIERALRSISGQSHPVDEIIVVDDGSTDDTAAVVSALPGVRYHRQTNAGASVARNTGVRLAAGRYVAFLDSDDVWLPTHVERMVAAAEATGHQAAVYFADCYFSAPGADDASTTLWARAGLRPVSPHELRADPTPWALMRLQPTMLQSAMIDRHAYLAAGGLDPLLRLRHDTSLFLTLAIGRAWCAVDNIGTRMTPEADNRLTGVVPDASPDYWHETVRMYTRALSLYAAQPDDARDELRSRLAVAHWRLARLGMRQMRSMSAAKPVVRHLTTAVRTHPSTVLASFSGWLGGPIKHRAERRASAAPPR